MDIKIVRYSSEQSDDWNDVISTAKNAIFLFERGFIEYHKERFVDISAISYIDGKPVALMPATIDVISGEVTSHAGLTYGGIVLKRKLRTDVSINVINAFLDALRGWGAKSFTIKMLPHIFTNYPSDELGYVLWKRNFSLIRRDVSSVLPLGEPLILNKSKKQAIKKAGKSGIVVTDASASDFHALLEGVLLDRHGVSPVHTISEMDLLMTRFPTRIRIRVARMGELILAGTMLFCYENVWHTQYLASSEAGRQSGALDLVISEAIREAEKTSARYFSFGISTENQGKTLNEGLLWQKESFGARTITHDFMYGVL